jgi:GTPase SAR1 family protein
MADPIRCDVFLSHNSKDKPVVRRLAERLKGAGLRVWFDEWAIKPGDDIYLAVERGLQDSRIQILCLSPAALGSDWVSLERSTVLFRDPANKNRRFIPLLIAECELPDTLRRYKYIDYRKATKTAFEELLAACHDPDEAAQPAAPGAADEESGAEPAETRKPQRIFRDRKTSFAVSSIALSSDGSKLVGGCSDKTVRLWDLSTGECTRFRGHSDEVRRVIFANDGRRIASASNEIILWDLKKERKNTYKTKSGYVRGIDELDSGRILTEYDHNKMQIIENESCSIFDIKTDFRSHGSIWAMCLLPDAVVIGTTAGFIGKYDVASGDVFYTSAAHSGSINSLVSVPSAGIFISASSDSTIKIWNGLTGKNVLTLEGHPSDILDLSCHPREPILASVGFGDTMCLWNWESGECLAVFRTGDEPMSVAFGADGSEIFVGMRKGTVACYLLDDCLSAPAASSRSYVNAKVVLIGSTGVGKTTLAHRLVEDRAVRTQSTHGMNIWRLDLPTPKDELEREALLWDLAGQDDYRLIHQLYLHDTALALLLINPQAEDPFAEAGDWVKALEMAARAAGDDSEIPKLLIPTRVDVGGLRVSEAKIKRFLSQYGFVGRLATSAVRGDNCSDAANDGAPSALKQLIAQSIDWDSLPSTSTPRLLAQLKDAVVALQSKEDIRLLRFAELSQRLEQALPGEAFEEGSVRTAVRLLANHGVIRTLKFGDLVLLRPDLLSGYAAAIIRAARAHKDEIGCVTEEALFAEDFDFTGINRLPRPDEELLLRALIQTLLDQSLCIREKEAGQTLLIFPSQYRRDREIPGHPNIAVEYRFSGELQTIYTTLVVRLWHGAPFDQKELWQNAAEFTTSTGKIVGLIFHRLGEGMGRLSIFFDEGVPEELKVVFAEFVHRHLQRYAQDLVRERRYACPESECGEPVVDQATVDRRIEAGFDCLFCAFCGTRIPLADHLEQRLSVEEVTRQVAAIDRMATSVLDNQAREQILVGHMMAICGEANQIFRDQPRPDYGIDGEVEFRDNSGSASGKKIYVQLKSGPSHLRKRKDGSEVFDVKDERHLRYWADQPVDVFLVIRDSDEVIRWMNVSRYLRQRGNRAARQIVFEGEKLDFQAVWRLRDMYLPERRAATK